MGAPKGAQQVGQMLGGDEAPASAAGVPGARGGGWFPPGCPGPGGSGAAAGAGRGTEPASHSPNPSRRLPAPPRPRRARGGLPSCPRLASGPRRLRSPSCPLDSLGARGRWQRRDGKYPRLGVKSGFLSGVSHLPMNTAFWPLRVLSQEQNVRLLCRSLRVGVTIQWNDLGVVFDFVLTTVSALLKLETS